MISEIFLILTLTGSNHLAAPNLDLGKQVYTERCKVCHGEKGNTNMFAAQVLDPPPRNFASAQSKKELSEERMIQSATHGRPGTAMMPWKGILSPEEIRSVIHFIRKELMGL